MSLNIVFFLSIAFFFYRRKAIYLTACSSPVIKYGDTFYDKSMTIGARRNLSQHLGLSTMVNDTLVFSSVLPEISAIPYSSWKLNRAHYSRRLISLGRDHTRDSMQMRVVFTPYEVSIPSAWINDNGYSWSRFKIVVDLASCNGFRRNERRAGNRRDFSRKSIVRIRYMSSINNAKGKIPSLYKDLRKITFLQSKLIHGNFVSKIAIEVITNHEGLLKFYYVFPL
jgi:hypothetical protein